MSCEFTEQDGAYVLGALSPAEHLQFEQHLSECAECTRSVGLLAGLPGLLARVDRTVLEEPPDDEELPTTLLPALLEAVRRTRRRRRVLVAAAAAAVVLAAVPTTLAVHDAVGGGTTTVAAPPAGAAGRAMTAVAGAPVRARLALAPVSWGTRLDLTCTYDTQGSGYSLPRAVRYTLVVRTRDGRTQQVGSWRALDGRTMRLTAATAAPRRDIASVQVRTTAGQPVLQLSS